MLSKTATIPPPSFLSKDSTAMETSVALIQKELDALTPVQEVDPERSAAFNESDPIDATLTLFELFLVKIQTKSYASALQIATEILKTDPRNPLILEYVPVLKEKMFLDLQDAETGAEDASSGDDDDDSGESSCDADSGASVDGSSDVSEVGTDSEEDDSTSNSEDNQ
ncbi:hypothetical protein BDR26DRAFT_862360 [Obelidium mucronatum]|nr:hypothetical protein BDR26DRAFT_862360 [Obelidium mucronatum]